MKTDDKKGNSHDNKKETDNRKYKKKSQNETNNRKWKQIKLWKQIQKIETDNKHTETEYLILKVTKSYSRRLPALERFFRETKFSRLKSTHSSS